MILLKNYTLNSILDHTRFISDGGANTSRKKDVTLWTTRIRYKDVRGPLWGQPSSKWGYFGHALKKFTEYPTLWISYLHILEPYLPN